MNTFLQLLDKGSAQILAPLKRFPLATFSAFIFILMISIKIHFLFNHGYENPYHETMEKVTFVSLLGFFLLVGLRLMARNFLVPFIGFLVLIGFYFYLPDSLDNYVKGEEGRVVFPMLLVGVVSFIVISPFIKNKASNREFFEWLKHLLYTVLISLVASIILFILLNIVLSILSGLFEINIEYRYRDHVSFFSFAFFAPYIFLSLLTKEPRALVSKNYNKLETFFFKYFLTGLFIAYFIIIYTYLGKMILLAEYPKGLVSINIITFSALALTTYLFWTPLWNEKNSKYKKIIWIAILLQLVLLAVALYLRVDAYGWTFGRFVLATLGFWLFTLSFYALLKKEISLRIIFLTLPLIVGLNLLFASSISKSSQQEKLGTLLASTNTLSNDSNLSLRYNISSTIGYLYGHYGTDALFPLMPDVVSEFNNQENKVEDNCAVSTIKNFPTFATEKLGFKYINKWEWKAKLNYEKNSEIEYMRMKDFFVQGHPLIGGIEVSKYDWIVNFDYHKKSKRFLNKLVCKPKSSSNIKQLYSIKTEANLIVIEKEKEVLASINIEEFTKKILQLDKNTHQRFNDNFMQENFIYVYENEKVKVQFIFKRFGFTLKDELVDYAGLLMIGKK